jgi:hypothetical protein
LRIVARRRLFPTSPRERGGVSMRRFVPSRFWHFATEIEIVARH